MYPPGAPVGQFQAHAERVQQEEQAQIAIVIVVGAHNGEGIAISTNATNVAAHLARQASVPAVLRAAADMIEAAQPSSIGVTEIDPLTGRRRS